MKIFKICKQCMLFLREVEARTRRSSLTARAPKAECAEKPRCFDQPERIKVNLNQEGVQNESI